ncbi:thermonuclease family protein [Nonomuraea sp. NPDC046570]|uniref:thermonuclease family protein n=1 Tax=Nonomuraea sp. NPDC046570 TaxID=3155255 RepID=UPI0033C8551F
MTKTVTARTVPDLYTYSAIVERVVDGDTFVLMVDVGFGVYTSQRVRLVGVYAPELGTPRGEAAAEFAGAWLAKHGPKLLVRTLKDRKERYGRYLARVESAATGEDLGETLIAAGHASTLPGQASGSSRDVSPGGAASSAA